MYALDPITLIARFMKVNLLENLTLLSPQHWSLENVKKVIMGRSRREGCLVRILREFLLLKSRVEMAARSSWGKCIMTSLSAMSAVVK